MSGLGGMWILQQPQEWRSDLGLERGAGCERQHVAAITGMLVRMVCSSVGNASLSSPPFPGAGCLSPAEAKISPAAPCWESFQLEKGEHWREGCPAAAGGDRDRHPSLGTARSTGKNLTIHS